MVTIGTFYQLTGLKLLCYTLSCKISLDNLGRVSERFKELVLKPVTSEAVGSNPTLRQEILPAFVDFCRL